MALWRKRGKEPVPKGFPGPKERPLLFRRRLGIFPRKAAGTHVLAPEIAKKTGIKSIAVGPLFKSVAKGAKPIPMHRLEFMRTDGTIFKARMIPGGEGEKVGVVYLRGMIPPPNKKFSAEEERRIREAAKDVRREDRTAFRRFQEATALTEQTSLAELAARRQPVITFEWTGSYENRASGKRLSEATVRNDITQAMAALKLLSGCKRVALAGWSIGATYGLWYASHASGVIPVLAGSPYHVQGKTEEGEMPPHVITKMVSPFFDFEEGLVERFEAGKAFDVSSEDALQRLARKGVPLVLTHARDDQLSSWRRTARMATHISAQREQRGRPLNLHYEITESGGHAAMTGKPGRTETPWHTLQTFIPEAAPPHRRSRLVRFIGNALRKRSGWLAKRPFSWVAGRSGLRGRIADAMEISMEVPRTQWYHVGDNRFTAYTKFVMAAHEFKVGRHIRRTRQILKIYRIYSLKDKQWRSIPVERAEQLETLLKTLDRLAASKTTLVLDKNHVQVLAEMKLLEEARQTPASIPRISGAAKTRLKEVVQRAYEGLCRKTAEEMGMDYEPFVELMRKMARAPGKSRITPSQGQ